MENKKQKPQNLNENIILIAKTKHLKTVEQLVDLVHQQYSMQKQDILKHILNLQEQGKLTLKEDTAHNHMSLGSYLSSSNSSWYWITVSLALVTTIAVFAIPENAYPIVYSRIVLGIIFVIFLPGFTLIKALFPTKELDNIERAALSLGMSLALVPVIGLILIYTPWGIKTTSITLSLLALTTIFATLAIMREYQNKTSHQ